MRNIVLIILALSFYFLLALPQINRIHSPDEMNSLRNSINLIAGKQTDLYSPPLYEALISIPIRIIGLNNASVKIVGYISVVLSSLLICLVINNIYKDNNFLKPIIFLAILIYCTHPMVIQGSHIIDRDNTIMPVMFLLLIYFLGKLESRSRYVFFLAILSFALFIWVKLSTSFLFMFICILGFFYSKKASKEEVLDILRIFFYGIVIFIGSWFTIAKISNLNFMSPIEYAGYRVGLSVFEPLRNVKVFISNLIHLSIWFSPYLLVSLFILLSKNITVLSDRLKSSQYYLMVGSISVLSYLFIAPIEQGFPKYYVPLVALSSIMVAPVIPRFLEGIGSKKRYIL